MYYYTMFDINGTYIAKRVKEEMITPMKAGINLHVPETGRVYCVADVYNTHIMSESGDVSHLFIIHVFEMTEFKFSF